MSKRKMLRSQDPAPNVVSFYFVRDEGMPGNEKQLCYAQLPPGFIVQAGATKALALEKVMRQIRKLFPDAVFEYQRI